ncbi:hypothetical protein BJ170DRAFT_609366 [Xylariales sp. AK1849]|nr:hypothetical protein BJ170DRAFT_609366 [Xylariales sp. AK1849]
MDINSSATNTLTKNASSILEACRVEEVSDPDVTGLGVILSFILSVKIAMGTIFFAYFRRALRPEQYNAFDEMLLTTWPFRLVALPPQYSSDNVLEKARIAALERFILATSDQLLITGTSLLLVTVFIIAGVGGLNAQWSVFSYQIAVYLGYASWTVHLSTLIVLCEHFRHHSYPQNTRIGAMIFTCVLLFTTRLTGSSISFTENPAVSVSCGLKYFNIYGGKTSDGSFWAVVSDLLPFLGDLLVLVGMVTMFLLKLLDIYSSSIPGIRSLPWEVAWPRSLMRVIYWPLKCDNHQTTLQHIYGRQRYESAAHLLDKEAQYGRQLSLMVITTEADKSFVSDLIGILTLLTYVMGRLLSSLLSDNAPVKAVMNPNFGQVMPLLLLVLPMLNILDVSSEMKTMRNRQENMESRSTKYPIRGSSIYHRSGLEEGPKGSIVTTTSPTESGVGRASTPSSLEPLSIDHGLNTICIEEANVTVYSIQHMENIGLEINIFNIALRHKRASSIAMLYIGLKFIIYQTVAVLFSGAVPNSKSLVVANIPVGRAGLVLVYFGVLLGPPSVFVMKFGLPLWRSRSHLGKEIRALGMR